MKPEASGAFYRSLFDNMVDGLAYCQMIFDLQGNPIDFIFVRTNKNFDKLFELKEVAGKKSSEVIPGINTSNPELFEIYSQVYLTGEPSRTETYIESLSKWFFVSVYRPKKDYFVAVYQNITDRRETEENLENATIAARNVLEDLRVENSKVEMARVKEEAILLSIGDGLIATDEHGRIILINKTAEKLLHVKNNEVKGKLVSDTIHVEDEKGVPILPEKRPVIKALTAGTTTANTATASQTLYYVRKDKTRFPTAFVVTPVIFEGKVIGAIEVFRDVTQEKAIDRAKDEFVSLASHQLRTPTTAINWYSEMLLSEEVGALNGKQKEYINEIHHGNQRMIDLVSMFLSVSRIELGTFAIQLAPTDIAKIVDDVLDEMKTRVIEKGLEVSKEYQKDIPVIESDPKLISVIVNNLLSNAVSYSLPQGKISVKISGLGSGFHIEIGDNGYGIPQSAQSKIYTKFFRADNANTIHPDGTGLGLYITKSILKALGGTISFTSKEGEGTIFSVNIPSRSMSNKS